MAPADPAAPPRPVPAGPLSIAPSMHPALDAVHIPPPRSLVSPRVLQIALLAIIIAAVAAVVARVLTALIGFVTNLAFYGRFSTAFSSPAGHHLGAWVIVVP